MMEVDPDPPHLIVAWRLRAIAPPPEFQVRRLSEPEALAAADKEISRLAVEQRFSGAALVARNGKPLLARAVGYADREHQIPNRLDTKFNLGSMNKMFTAVAIAELAQEGKLTFNDPMGKYLADYPNPQAARKVTIHNLLTHTGGTGDIFGPEFEANLEKLREPQDYVRLYGKRAPAFEPGSRWEYSNYGFVLLGAIIEKVSGQSYYDYIREHVYQPAGMTSSDSYWKTEKIPNQAIGYTRVGTSQLHPNYDSLPMRGSPAGGGYSTVTDLLSFANALLNHKLLSENYLRLVTTGKAAAPGGKYAYGFEDQSEGGVRWFGHGGGAPRHQRRFEDLSGLRIRRHRAGEPGPPGGHGPGRIHREAASGWTTATVLAARRVRKAGEVLSRLAPLRIENQGEEQ